MQIARRGPRFPRLSAGTAILIFVLCQPARSQRIVNTVAGGASEDGMAAAPAHVAINGAAACPNRTVLLSSPGRIYRVTTDGALHVIAGNGVTGVNGDGGSALAAQVWPAGPIACDAQGITIFADNARIRRIDTHGIVTTVAGDGLPVGSAVNGVAAQTPLDIVGGIAIDSGGSIYFSEPNSNRVRVVKTDGTVALFAGTPSTDPADSGDGGPAITASVWSPSFLAVDPIGNVYIAEATKSIQSLRIRKVTPSGVISTILGGAPSTSAPVDGQSANSAYLYSFTSMAIDAGGNLYIGTASPAGVFAAFGSVRMAFSTSFRVLQEMFRQLTAREPYTSGRKPALACRRCPLTDPRPHSPDSPRLNFPIA